MGSDLRSDDDHGRRGLSGPAIAETLRAAASLRSPVSSLQALIGMMIETGPWTAGSICLQVANGKLDTDAYLDARALQCDRLQAELHEGPAYDAVQADPVQVSVDLAGERRWTTWSSRAVDTGVCSTMSLRLFTSITLGTVNLYSTRAGGPDAADVCAARVMAASVSVAVETISTERHLRQAMGSRNVIGQAQGMLMQRHRITADQALQFLRRRSQQSNIKLIVLAGQLADAGTVPDIDDWEPPAL